MIKKPKISVRLSGPEIQKTKFGWKTKCKRCGATLKFGDHEIQSTGSGFELSAYSLVASGAIYVKELNELAEDFEKGEIDWAGSDESNFMRRQRRLYFRMAQTPNSAFTMQSALKLICPQCNAPTTIQCAFGEEVELKKLPMDYEALLKLGIKKKENIQHFQLRTGQLAKDFVEKIRFADNEIKLLEETKVKVKELIDTIESPSDTVAEVLSDVTATARASAEAQILNLKKWMQTTVSMMETRLFPDVQGGGVKEIAHGPQTTTDLHTVGTPAKDQTSLRQEIERQRQIQQRR